VAPEAVAPVAVELVLVAVELVVALVLVVVAQAAVTFPCRWRRSDRPVPRFTTRQVRPRK
jgi:hypothetical protein